MAQHYVKATLSSAQMSASFTTAKNIVAAQGADMVIWPEKIRVKYIAASGSAIVGGNATTLKVGSATVFTQDFNGLTATTFYERPNAVTTAVASGMANAALSIQTATADPTFYGKVEVEIWYDVVTLS